MEETGFDASSLLDKDNYVEHMVGDTYSRLYIIPGMAIRLCFMVWGQTPLLVLSGHRQFSV